jgi:hypothetical protein
MSSYSFLLFFCLQMALVCWVIIHPFLGHPLICANFDGTDAAFMRQSLGILPKDWERNCLEENRSVSCEFVGIVETHPDMILYASCPRGCRDEPLTPS